MSILPFPPRRRPVPGIYATIAILVFFAFLRAHTASALELSARIDPPAATIGDRLRYEITAKDAAGTDLPLKLEDPSPFEVLSAKGEEDKGIKRVIFTLAVFKTGKIPLPAYTAHWVDKGNKPNSATAPPLFVEIRSVLPQGEKEPKLMDIEKEAEARIEWKDYLIPAGIALAVIAIALATYYFIKKRPHAPAATAAGIQLSPYETAMQKLERIQRENAYRDGKVKEYFSGIADTLREYIRGEYGIDAPEKTTGELERVWPPMLETGRGKVFPVLGVCDAAKFAKTVPTSEEAAAALANAFEFIKSSSKVKSLPPPEEARKP